MNLDLITKELREFLNQNSLNLYEVTYHKKDVTLSVVLDETLSMDRLEEVSAMISSFMDKYDDDITDNYILDVTTVGVERPIKTVEEIEKAVGSYIFVKTKEEKINGTLVKFENDTLTLSYKDKTRDRKIDINLNKVKQMRYAVKF